MISKEINCGEINESYIGSSVKVYGWCRSIRDHGGKLFVDLADRYGITQLVFERGTLAEAKRLGREYVIMAEGIVEKRDADTVDTKIPTGMVEINVKNTKIISASKTPPFELIEEKKRFLPDEEVRLKYRYLDLRTRRMIKNIELRHKITKSLREFLWAQDFLELETPTLVRETYDTGARTFLVPSSTKKGSFYSLPQSPQLYKQICMIGGLDKYFQIARCYRDEDPREDRQPEFTQIDIEMSFKDERYIQGVVERMLQKAFADSLNYTLETPFRHMSFDEAMTNYGSDKPDLRFGSRIIDITSEAGKSSYNILKRIVANGGSVKALLFDADYGHSSKITSKYMLKVIELVKSYGLQGLTWLYVEKGKILSEPPSIADAFRPIEKELLAKFGNVEDGSIIVIGSDLSEKLLLNAMGKLRNVIGAHIGKYSTKYAFAWIDAFPLFEKDDITGKLKPSHNPVTAPTEETAHLIDTDPSKVISRQYDLVLNGYELGSGSIRITDPKLQKKILKMIGIEEESAEDSFGFFLEALSYGTPIHGGIALGLDRLVAIAAGSSNIRDFILFPKNKKYESPLDGSPSAISKKRLFEDFGISLDTHAHTEKISKK